MDLEYIADGGGAELRLNRPDKLNVAQTGDIDEGARARMEKRAPQFKGR